jgi:hypothetical protein
MPFVWTAPSHIFEFPRNSSSALGLGALAFYRREIEWHANSNAGIMALTRQPIGKLRDDSDLRPIFITAYRGAPKAWVPADEFLSRR